MAKQEPPDLEASIAKRITNHRDAYLQIVKETLAEYGFARIPAPIVKAVNELVWKVEREGEHFAKLRKTLQRDPHAKVNTDPNKTPPASRKTTPFANPRRR